ncbi:molecular chaperone [Pseudoalteromonas piscicida]|uniref:molecular chaperone n=1 Tax=Pseudoalteromonas piscicida TaxID=43662 RepID=UPI000E35F4BF|nr:molecular chaperone [Pseudoalteromonas piscicida]AXQ97162.1 molecular chaperone [Pseudoalteromonas piscicida]
MKVGFDYGSSNCAMGVMQNGEVDLLRLEQDKYYLPSTMYAMHNALIPAFVNRHLNEPDPVYTQSRQGLLTVAQQAKRDLDLEAHEAGVFFGQAAISEYIEFPEEGFFVKSPKSFFGAVGLKPQQIAFFEDIAAAMMMEIKRRAESQLQQSITDTVIGRPVNFQSVGGEESNQQAVNILTTAAKRAGFKEVDFLFEPLAAGIEYESRLQQDKLVLVVDIGGGTSDCSFVRMGPSYRNNTQRQQDFLAHTGKRIGGNDLDIALAYHQLMPLCGLGSNMSSGLPMPSQLYWQACKINDIQSQLDFYSDKLARELQSMLRDVAEPQKLARLLHIQQNKLTHQVVREGELGKIALSEQAKFNADLGFIEPQLTSEFTQQDFAESVMSNLEQMGTLAKEAIHQAGSTPDVIYLTGGSAQSPLLKATLAQQIGDIEMVNGDNFGSVTAGLTKWADKLFK